MIAIALLLSWLPPLDNCDGSALIDLDHYLLETERIVKVGEMVNADGTHSDVVVRTLLAVPLAVDVTQELLADPAPGGMIAYRLAAYDWAGNRDCESERPTGDESP